MLAVLLGTWASDIFAYFGGRLFGRHRLAPAISPKKTVEGFVIGLAAGIFTTWVTLYRQGFTNQEALLVGVGVALAAPLGDLFESFLKRDLGVKDSGTLLGGPRRRARPHRRAALRRAGGARDRGAARQGVTRSKRD